MKAQRSLGGTIYTLAMTAALSGGMLVLVAGCPTVGGGGSGCDPACEAGFECVDGTCEAVAADCDPACEAGSECVDGECIPATGGDPVAGEAFYAANNCAACHCDDATGGCIPTAPSLVGEESDAIFSRLSGAEAHTGPPVEGVTQEDADDLAAWLAAP